MGTGSFQGVKLPRRNADHPPPSSAEVKERAVPLLPLWAYVACSRLNFTFTLQMEHSRLVLSPVIMPGISSQKAI